MGGAELVWTISLRTVHTLLWLRESLRLMVVWVWTSLLYAVKHKGTKLECIQGDTKDLKKVPMHIAMVVQEEELSYSDLANIVVWSFSVGVRNVSLYDPKGKLRNQVVTLRNAVVMQHHRMFSPPVPDVEVYTSEDLPLHSSDYGSSCSVLVLTPEDGRQNLVSMATSVCHSVLKRQLQVKDIGTALVASRITAISSLPDPDLAIVFGGTSSTMGFPPWQLRLTEILTLPSHHKLTYQDYHSVLQRYANCQQRYGK